MDDDLREMMLDVPDLYAARFAKLAERTDGFRDAHLNAEYKQLCREMAAVVCQNASSALRGKPSGWAAGIVYALGRVNFLTDPNQTPHMAAAEIAEKLGVSQATMMNKAKVIRQGLDLMPLHADWCLPSKQADKRPHCRYGRRSRNSEQGLRVTRLHVGGHVRWRLTRQTQTAGCAVSSGLVRAVMFLENPTNIPRVLLTQYLRNNA